MPSEKIKKIIVVTVSLLFILSLLVIYSNFHFHINNNFLIFYSHPYDKTQNNPSPIKSHPHSSLAFLFYFSLVNIDGIVFFSLAILTLTILIKYVSNFSNRLGYNDPTFLLPVLRAPPLILNDYC